MKRIHSFKVITLFSCMIFICIIISLYLLIRYHNNDCARIVVCIMIILVAGFLVKIFLFPDYIEITEDKMSVSNNPFFATNKFYEQKRYLILWNNEIYLNEVEKIAVVNLSKNEKKSLVGYNHLFNRYLKVYIKNSTCKYIYISIYSNKQINEIIKCLTKHNRKTFT